MGYDEQLSAAKFRAERDLARQEVKELREELEAMRLRLMPEGMEWLLEVWPKWSNGEYCKFGDWWTADKYGDYEPRQLRRLVFYTPEQLREWEQDEGDNFGYEWDFMRPSDTTYRPDKAEPPAPKVLDAEGAEIREGETVYDKDTGDRFEVDGFSDWYVICTDIDSCESDLEILPSQLTHQRPVLDAGGVPIKGGDTIYSDGYKEGLIVDGYQHDGSLIAHMRDGNHVVIRKPQHFTHTKPEIDTWERIEEDAVKDCWGYWGCEMHLCTEGCPNEVDGKPPYKRLSVDDCCDAQALDLVRRAKKLAGVE